MNSEMTWLPLSMMAFVVLTMNLKGKWATLALGVYLWGLASWLAGTQWHLHQEWLADLSQIQRADPQYQYAPEMIAHHRRSICEGLAVDAAFMLTPFVFYWFDCRNARAAVKPIQVA